MKCFIVQNFYIMFHDKLKFSNFFVKQIRLFFIFHFEKMRVRQMRIIFYFKSVINSFTSLFFISTKIKLISNKKHAEFKNHDQSIQNRDLTSNAFKNVSFSLISIDHFIHRICRRCKQHFNSKIFLHKHLAHCNKNIFNCCSKYSSSKLRMKKKR